MLFFAMQQAQTVLINDATEPNVAAKAFELLLVFSKKPLEQSVY